MKYLSGMLRAAVVVVSVGLSAPSSRAAVLTFDQGSFVQQGSIWVYFEAGLEVAWFGGSQPPILTPTPTGVGLEMNGSATDVLIFRVGGGTFTSISIYQGGRDTSFGGFHGDFVTGGQPADTSFSPSGVGSTFFFDQTWTDITTIDWCNYCIQLGGNGGIIDNLVFNTPAVPEPTSWILMMLGFVGIGLVAYRRARRGVTIAA